VRNPTNEGKTMRNPADQDKNLKCPAGEGKTIRNPANEREIHFKFLPHQMFENTAIIVNTELDSLFEVLNS